MAAVVVRFAKIVQQVPSQAARLLGQCDHSVDAGNVVLLAATEAGLERFGQDR